jgi:hypothetical protein
LVIFQIEGGNRHLKCAAVHQKQGRNTLV